MRFTELRNRLYYSVRPLIPRPVQIELRSTLARRRRRAFVDSWPILPSAGRPPQGWPGWPDQRQFALILLHDVETARGQDRCLALMHLEQRMGFRSAFNFVPERYPLIPSVRETLAAQGFEIGVHGLTHDGKLFQSRAIFRERAKRINSYLQQWGSVGFVSPSSHHNLAWMHDLNIEYDSSTFDTDPFEPQADGVQTIFPLWVSRGDTSDEGYVELPYTLPQDFTLFILMRERANAIWKRKLDWIVQHGGMALVIAHPDYMCFSGTPAADEYPVAYYQDFLAYVRASYQDRFWQPLPREAAAFFRRHTLAAAAQGQSS
ncbi:MAG: hypothetical protein HGA45_12285 [Chloroflexales bacterium]|nr:hypothetical protein [Chloroflexales bacterium]